MSLFVISHVAGATVPYHGDRDSLLALLLERLNALHQELSEVLGDEGSKKKALKLHADIMSVAKEIDRVTAQSGEPPKG